MRLGAEYISEAALLQMRCTEIEEKFVHKSVDNGKKYGCGRYLAHLPIFSSRTVFFTSPRAPGPLGTTDVPVIFGRRFQRFEIRTANRLLGVDPGHARAHLLGGHVLALALHITYGAAVLVMGSRGDGRALLEAHGRKVLARHLTECLALLGGVNRADADGDLLVGLGLTAAGLDGVTVGDGDDQAKEGCSRQGLAGGVGVPSPRS